MKLWLARLQEAPNLESHYVLFYSNHKPVIRKNLLDIDYLEDCGLVQTFDLCVWNKYADGPKLKVGKFIEVKICEAAISVGRHGLFINLEAA